MRSPKFALLALLSALAVHAHAPVNVRQQRHAALAATTTKVHHAAPTRAVTPSAPAVPAVAVTAVPVAAQPQPGAATSLARPPKASPLPAANAPAKACQPYDFPPVDNMIHSYPDIWVTADLSKASPEDLAVYNAIAPGIPDIAPRGTRDGNMTGVVYDAATDPDCYWTATRCTTPKVPGLLPDVTNCDEPNVWGLSIDDGPNCTHDSYYDYLQLTNQKATLFYIGSNVLDWPLQAQRGLKDGHEICAHTWSHPYMTAMTNEQAFAEIYYSVKAIKDVLGITVQCFRFPFGDVDDRLRYIVQSLKLRTIMWSEDTFDWDYTTLGTAAVQKNYETILAKAAAGQYDERGIIVLSHELDAETMALSQQFLPQIQAAFKGGVMPVATCMNTSSPYLEQEDVYPVYSQWAAGIRSVSLAAPTALGNVDVQLVASTTTLANGETAVAGINTAASSSSSPSATPATSHKNGAPRRAASGLVIALTMLICIAIL